MAAAKKERKEAYYKRR